MLFVDQAGADIEAPAPQRARQTRQTRPEGERTEETPPWGLPPGVSRGAPGSTEQGALPCNGAGPPAAASVGDAHKVPGKGPGKACEGMARKGDYVSWLPLPEPPRGEPGASGNRHARPRACGRTCAPRRCPGAEASPSSPAALLFFFKATARDSWRQLALDLAGAVLSRPFLETGLFRPRSSCPPPPGRVLF